ncbi:MAG: TonB-dependent receptor, partial [Terriglobales bacterium]
GKKASFFLNVQRRSQDETSIINAVVLDNNFNQVPYSTAVPNPVTRIEINPRFDFQLSKNNTLTARYEFGHNESTNGGLNTFSLPTYSNNSVRSNHELQISDSQVLSNTVVNDTRFQFERNINSTLALSLDPTISVSGAFTSGGNSGGNSADHTDHYELQNSTRMTRGRHLLTFGGRLRVVRDSNQSTSGYNGSFTFDSLTAYQVTMRDIALGKTAAQIRADGGGASQFRISGGIPLVAVSQADAGLFAEDTWALRKNMTLTSGLRFETQDNIPNHFNFAPRLGFAWGLGNANKGASKTVLRLGGGIFYDRFSEGLVMQAERLNGITQQQYVVTNPDFYPNVPAIGTLTGALSSPTTYTIASNLHTPYMIQGAVAVEHQLTKTATLSVTYLHSKGVHQLLTHNINAPLPGTYTGPGTGVRPLGGNNNVYEYFSEGTFKQDQVITNANVRLGRYASLNSFYMLSWANGNASGSGSFPVNQYSLAGEYGRTAFDVRQRFFIGGNVTGPYGFRLAPFIVVSSGAPFNITLGHDLNGDSIFNDRPTFATDLARTSVVATRWGTFDTAPLPGQTIIPAYYGNGPGQVSINLRLSKVIGFGPSTNPEARGGGRGGDGGPRGGGGEMHGGGPGGGRPGGGMVRMGGGGGPFGGAGGTGKRYNLTFTINANNVLNHVNPSSPVGNLTSPLFGTSNSIAGGFGGGASANRRVMLQVMFGF